MPKPTTPVLDDATDDEIARARTLLFERVQAGRAAPGEVLVARALQEEDLQRDTDQPVTISAETANMLSMFILFVVREYVNVLRHADAQEVKH